MGLHRDGDAYGLTPLETHVRRLIWHQLCFLDIRTCEAQGPKPAIRREDYDTKLPINCGEDELTHAVTPPSPAEHWTSTLLPLMRFEINEMMRIIWVDRRKLETHRTTLTAVLTKIENFRKRMLDKYDHFLNDAVPVQKYAKLVMHLLMYRLHAMVLHPYHSNVATPMPARLGAVLVMSGIMIIEIAIQLDTNALYAPWAWYLGAYQQYHIALLLATEIYYRPNSKEADRIWPCLDFVFSMDRAADRQDKGRRILHEIMSKTAVYTGMRRMRAPAGTSRAVPDRIAVRPEPSPHLPSPPAPAPAQAQAQAQAHAQAPPAAMPMYPHAAMQHQQQQQPQLSHMPMGTAHPQAPPAAVAGPAAGPPPNVVFAGVSNGEVLWSLPPQPNADSPESSNDGATGQGQAGRGVGGPTAGRGQSYLDNFDWVSFRFFSFFF
jgi:hypothetical protein